MGGEQLQRGTRGRENVPHINAAVHLWSGKQSNPFLCVCAQGSKYVFVCVFLELNSLFVHRALRNHSKMPQHEKYMPGAATNSRKTPIYIIACYLFNTPKKALDICVDARYRLPLRHQANCSASELKVTSRQLCSRVNSPPVSMTVCPSSSL